jgi:hypothetical protein
MEWWNAGIVGGKRDAKCLDIPSAWQSLGSPKSRPPGTSFQYSWLSAVLSAAALAKVEALAEVDNSIFQIIASPQLTSATNYNKVCPLFAAWGISSVG